MEYKTAGMKLYKNLHNYNSLRKSNKLQERAEQSLITPIKTVVFLNILYFSNFDNKKVNSFFYKNSIFLPTCDGVALFIYIQPCIALAKPNL